MWQSLVFLLSILLQGNTVDRHPWIAKLTSNGRFFFCQRTAWHFSWMMHTRDNVLWISFLSPVNKIYTHKKSIICKDQCGIAVVISSNLFQLNLLRTQLKITFFLPNIKLLVQWKVESFYVVLVSVWCENINRLSFSKILIEVLYLNPIESHLIST